MQPGGRDQACWKRKIRAFPWGQATGIHHLKFAHLVVTSSSASRCSARSCPHRSSSPPFTPTSTPRSSARSRPCHCSSLIVFRWIRVAIFGGLRKAQAAHRSGPGVELVSSCGGDVPHLRGYGSRGAGDGGGGGGAELAHSSAGVRTGVIVIFSILHHDLAASIDSNRFAPN